MSPRPRSDDETILQAALEVIADVGVAGLTVDAVAAHAGVGKATIYRHWGSRARLVHAALFANLHEWTEPDTGSLRGDVVLLLEQLVEYLGEPDSARVFTSFLEAAARDPELRMLLDETEQAGRSRFARAIRRGIDRDELPPDVDVRLLVDLLMSPVVYRRVLVPSTVRPRDVARVVDTVLAAFAPSGTTA